MFGFNNSLFPADAKSDPRTKSIPSPLTTGRRNDGGHQPPTRTTTVPADNFEWSGHEKYLRDLLADPRLRPLDRKRIEDLLMTVVWLKDHPQPALIRQLRTIPKSEGQVGDVWLG